MYVLLYFGVSDVGATLQIQTYCTEFVHSLILNELLNLSRKCVHSNLQLQHGSHCELLLALIRVLYLLSCLGKSLHTHIQFILVCASLHGRKRVRLKLSCSCSHSHAFSVPMFDPVEMPKLPHPCRTSISTNLRDPSAVIYGSFNRLWLHHCSLFSLFQRKCSFACDVLRFSFASFVSSSTGAWLILWIPPTFFAQVAFLTAVPTTPSPFLPFLPLLLPLPNPSTSIGSEVFFAATVLNAN